MRTARTPFRDGAENYHEAVSALRKHIEAALEASAGGDGTGYDAEANAVAAMRAACVAAAQAPEFNSHLKALGKRFQGDPARGAFWGALAQRGLTLISAAEVPPTAPSTATAEEAAAYLEEMRSTASQGAVKSEAASCVVKSETA